MKLMPLIQRTHPHQWMGKVIWIAKIAWSDEFSNCYDSRNKCKKYLLYENVHQITIMNAKFCMCVGTQGRTLAN